MTGNVYSSWGRYPASSPACAVRPAARAGLPALLSSTDSRSTLAYGNGRSYGDSCLNNGGRLLDMRGLDRFIHFDPASGIVECEPGLLIADLLARVIPQGWFIPVTPGTQYVTIGGAIANDVHGKNHHVAGTLGCHVLDFDLLTSDGWQRCCSPSEHADWFGATIGGLGLTGLITRVRLALRRIQGPWLDVETHRFADLSGFFALSADSNRDYEYTVAWVDCSAKGRRLGRGWFMRANHRPALGQPPAQAARRRPAMALTPPFSLMNRATLRPLNTLYFHRKRRHCVRDAQHYQSYFYPLDGIRDWNRAYGPKGFLQYQCVVPMADGQAVIGELLARIAAAGAGSFLSVLKVFGTIESPGWLSFPRPGVTLALDFPHQGHRTLALLDTLDTVVREAGGAVYPAKDARMAPAAFRDYFPNWTSFADYVDPGLSSSFWRRVTGQL